MTVFQTWKLFLKIKGFDPLSLPTKIIRRRGWILASLIWWKEKKELLKTNLLCGCDITLINSFFIPKHGLYTWSRWILTNISNFNVISINKDHKSSAIIFKLEFWHGILISNAKQILDWLLSKSTLNVN